MTGPVEFITHPIMPIDSVIAPHAADFYDEKRKEYNFMKTTNGTKHEDNWKFKAPNMNDNNYKISIGRNLMQSLPLIEMKDIVGKTPDQVMDLANKKFREWEPSYPKMPCIYVYEDRDGETHYSKTCPLKDRMIAKIDHYIVTDIPQLKVPDKKQVVEDLLRKVVEVMFEE